MLFYLSVFFLCVFFAFVADYTRYAIRVIAVGAIVLILSFVGGMRDIGIGTDTTVYSMSYFLEAKHINSWKDFIELDYDKGYVLLNYISTRIGNEVWIAHFVVQLFTNGLIFCAAYKFRKVIKLKLSLFTLVYCCIFYNQSYNFMRQYCALSLLLVGLYCICNKQILAYIVCQVLAFFFHSSSVLFVAVPILYYTCTVGYKKKWHYVAVFGSMVLIFLMVKFYYDLLSLFNSWEIVSEVYVDRYGQGDKWGGREGIRKSLILLQLSVFYLLFIAYKRKVVQRSLVMFVLSVNFMFIAFYLLAFHSMYLYRLSLYFYLPLMLFISCIISYKKFYSVERLGFAMVVLLDWYFYIVRHQGAEAFPYQSKILGI